MMINWIEGQHFRTH